MSDRDAVLKAIHDAFGANTYPGDPFLQGSTEGCEPADAVAPFLGCTDWRTLDAALLDAQYTALSFFSEAALRFFLPAYLVADVQERLRTADPLFGLVGGFSDVSVGVQTAAGAFVRKTGRSAFLNPRRYGAMTFYDYACWRLSVFTREETGAIVDYLRYKHATVDDALQREKIDAALQAYWLARAETAPTAADLADHLREEAAYLAALSGAEGEAAQEE